MYDFKDLDAAFDSIIEEIENPGSSKGKADIFRNLHGEKTEYADYAKAVYTIVIRVADDNMSAAINVVSTAEKIRRYTIQELNRAIRQRKIVHGIDSEALMKMVSKQTFNRDVVFAKGDPPHHGSDGVIEHYIDFSASDKAKDIKKDTPICHVIPPTAGTAGWDVYGHSIPARNGASISVPVGENTAFDKKTNTLYATAGGRLYYENGVYKVNDEYVINGNVTGEMGKIDFAGNIIIRGNVTGEAVVTAGKSIYIEGKVKESVIYAKENLRVDHSVTESELTTENGSMQLSSCYDSVIKCGGDLELAALSNCKTRCLGNLDCTINQGSINGGETFSIGRMTCTTVGSRLHEKTELTVGDCSEFLTERIKLMRTLSRIENDVDKVSRRIGTIEGQRSTLGFISKEDEDFLTAAIRIRTQKENEKIPILERMEKIEKIIQRASEANLKVMRSLHANVYLKIKEHNRETDTEYGKITAYTNDYGIVFS